ncbi:hypothetical protein H0Z60_14795 [Ectothiorhodospiraceae bacterium WFHF3C12]|nr:hypothetical protein [Ectothiorhodospiraceae bacterium WFHF3C12]
MARGPSTRAAIIRRESRKAQQRIRELEGEAQRQLRAIYERARDEISADIRSLGDDNGNLRMTVLQDLRRQIDQRLAALSGNRGQLLDEVLGQSASIGTGPFSGELATSTLSRISDDAVRQVRNFVAEDGLQLSDRLWRIDQHARDAVGQAVSNAVARGRSASRAAQDFLQRGEPVPAELQRKMGLSSTDRVARIAGDALMTNPDERTAYQNARRVFRTEINRAHGLAYQASVFEHPDTAGTRFMLSPRHPRRDICDMHANVNRYGLGPGVYPQGKSPWPAHPNTLSFEEVVFTDEVTGPDREGKQDRVTWLRQQPPQIQEAVLNSRRKRVALERGILRENQIATPWVQLKERYRRQGVDLDRLRPDPLEAKTVVRRGQSAGRTMAEQYVLENGRRDGVEYALAFDESDGTELFRKTSQQRSAVYFDANEVALFDDSSRAIELVHNHPSSSSLSFADLNLATRPGVYRIVAVGHDESLYSARLSPDVKRGLKGAHKRAESVARANLQVAVNDRDISPEQANKLHGHIINSALGRAGIMEYEIERQGPGIGGAIETFGEQRMDKVIEQAAKAAKG